MKYTKDIVGIDEEHLDQVVLEHAEVVFQCGMDEADARHAHAQAEAFLKLTEAKVRALAVGSPSKFKLPESPTVPAIAAAVISSEKYQAAVAAVNAAKHDVDRIAVAVRALEHRKRMIEAYLELRKMGFHSDPRVPKRSPGMDYTVTNARKRKND